VKYVIRDYPLESIHPFAFKASEAVRCAGDQNKYWEMHDLLFNNQRQLAPADLSKHAAALKMDTEKFQQCLDSSRHADAVKKDLADGQTATVKGTPTFFLGVEEGSKLKVIRVIRGAGVVSGFKSNIDAALAAAK
jgi:protein-disulfide isomerase